MSERKLTTREKALGYDRVRADYLRLSKAIDLLVALKPEWTWGADQPVEMVHEVHDFINGLRSEISALEANLKNSQHCNGIVMETNGRLKGERDAAREELAALKAQYAPLLADKAMLDHLEGEYEQEQLAIKENRFGPRAIFRRNMPIRRKDIEAAMKP